MQHLGTKRLETQRLILRPFTMDDAPAMFANWASESEVTKYLTWPTHTGVDVSEKVLVDWVGHYGEPDYYQWAIVPKDVGETRREHFRGTPQRRCCFRTHRLLHRHTMVASGHHRRSAGGNAALLL